MHTHTHTHIHGRARAHDMARDYDVEAGCAEKQRLLGARDSEAAAKKPNFLRGVGDDDEREADARAANASDAGQSGGGDGWMTRGGGGLGGGARLCAAAVLVVGACACVIVGVMMSVATGGRSEGAASGVSGGGDGGGRSLILPPLGLGDAGYGRELTPDERAWKEKIESEASLKTREAVGALMGLRPDQLLDTPSAANLGHGHGSFSFRSPLTHHRFILSYLYALRLDSS